MAVDVGRLQVSVPIDAGEPLILESSAPRSGISPVEISLPAELQVADAETASDGSVVYEAKGNSAGAVVQTLDDGTVRLHTIIPNASAPHRFTYSFGDSMKPMLMENGMIGLSSEFDGGAVVVATIDAPWAVDAKGNAVKTSYSVEGATLVQVVEPSKGLYYPIVADPSVSYGWRIYVKYNKSETRAIASMPGVTRAKYLAAVCAIIPAAPVAAGCGLVAYDVITSVVSTFKSAKAVGKCVQLGYIPVLYPPPGTPILTSWKVVSC